MSTEQTCQYIITSKDGTSYCSLAETSMMLLNNKYAAVLDCLARSGRENAALSGRLHASETKCADLGGDLVRWMDEAGRLAQDRDALLEIAERWALIAQIYLDPTDAAADRAAIEEIKGRL